jgi:hypothetical protein
MVLGIQLNGHLLIEELDVFLYLKSSTKYNKKGGDNKKYA